MREADGTSQCNSKRQNIEHILLLYKTIEMQYPCHTIKHHVAEIYLHTDTTQILHYFVIEHHILSPQGIHQPSREHNQIGQDLKFLECKNKHQNG